MANDGQVRVLNRRTYYPGDTIFHEGDLGSQAFVVQRGRVRIVRKLPDGERATLGFIEEGGIFGEMALIDQSPRMASAVAEETATCIVIPEQLVRTKLRNADPVLRTMINVMIRMIRALADEAPLPPDEIAALEGMSETVEDAQRNGRPA